ncbi:hypothetical protein DFH06DRAFT_1328473 [Mycena polygramma]|nr:hypothetical protein DFH06DRAFT_1328473 [Mycena polygramma]
MEPSDIDTVSLPAVKNLRSKKFEQLALGPAQNDSGLAPGITPRPRVTSATQSNGDRKITAPAARLERETIAGSFTDQLASSSSSLGRG